MQQVYFSVFWKKKKRCSLLVCILIVIFAMIFFLSRRACGKNSTCESSEVRCGSG